jgi:hypothetical protein
MMSIFPPSSAEVEEGSKMSAARKVGGGRTVVD